MSPAVPDAVRRPSPKGDVQVGVLETAQLGLRAAGQVESDELRGRDGDRDRRTDREVVRGLDVQGVARDVRRDRVQDVGLRGDLERPGRTDDQDDPDAGSGLQPREGSSLPLLGDHRPLALQAAVKEGAATRRTISPRRATPGRRSMARIVTGPPG